MANSVIRSDVVQIGFDINDSPLSSLLSSIQHLQNSIVGLDTDSSFRDISNGAQSANSSVGNLIQTTNRLGNTDVDSLANDIRHIDNVSELTEESLRDLRTRAEALGDANGANELRTEINRISSQSNITDDDLQSLRRTAERLGSSGTEELRSDLNAAGQSAGEVTTELRQTTNAAENLADSTRDIEGAADQASKGMSSGFTIVKGVVADLISNGIQRLIGSITDLAKETIQVGAGFESSMSEVAAISGATGDDLQMLRDTAKEFGSTTTFSASESAQALKYMALAGWDAEKSSSALGGVLDLAASAGMDLAQASDMVTDYMSAFGMEAERSGYFADMLSYSQSNANTSVEQLGEAFKNCAANMNAAGQDVETTTSLLAMMANQGFKGSEAGTALTAVMRDMTAKMKDGAIKIGDTSIAVQDAQGNYRDLTDILIDVEAATQGMGDAERATALASTFTADSIKGMNLLLNAGVGEAADFEEQLRGSGITVEGLGNELANSGKSLDDMKKAFEKAGVSSEAFDEILKTSRGSADLFIDGLGEACDAGYNVEDVMKDVGISNDELAKAFENSAGTAKKTADIMNDNLNGDITALKSQIEGLQISVYEKLQPALRGIVGVASEILTKIPEIISNIKEFIASSGIVDGLKAAFERVKAILEPLVLAIWDVINSIWQFVTSPQVIDGVTTAFEKVKAIAEPIIGIIARVVKEIANIVMVVKNIATSQPVVTALGVAFGALKTVFDAVYSVAKTVFTFINNNLEWILPLVEGVAIAFGAVKAGLIAIKIAQIAYNAVMTVTNGIIAVYNALMAVSPTTWIIIGIGLLIGAIILCIKYWDEIKAAMLEAWDKAKEVWGKVADWFSANVIDPVVNFFKGMWEKIKLAFTTAVEFVKENWKILLAFILNPVAGVFAALYKYNDGFREKVDSILAAIKAAVMNAIHAVINFFTPLVNAVVAITSKIVEIVMKIIEIIYTLCKVAVLWVYNNVITPVINFFINLWNTITSGAQMLWNGIVAIFSIVASWVYENIISPVVNFVTELWNKVVSIANSIWNGIVDIFSKVASWVKDNIIDPVVNLVTDLYKKIKGIIQDTWKSMVDTFSKAASWVNTHVVQPVVKFMKDLWHSITEIFKSVSSWFSQKFTDAVGGIKSAFGTVVSFFQGIWNSIKEMFTNIGTTIGNGIAGAFASVVNGILGFAEDTINGFIRSINFAIDTINNIPGVEISTIAELNIPRLAKGGVVDKPTIAEIGEDGKEAVVPLENNLGWVKKIVSGVANAIKAPSNQQASYNSSNRLYKTFNDNTEYNYYSPSFTLNMNGSSASEDNKRKVKQWVRESMSEVFDSLERSNRPMQEV